MPSDAERRVALLGSDVVELRVPRQDASVEQGIEHFLTRIGAQDALMLDLGAILRQSSLLVRSELLKDPMRYFSRSSGSEA